MKTFSSHILNFIPSMQNIQNEAELKTELAQFLLQYDFVMSCDLVIYEEKLYEVDAIISTKDIQKEIFFFQIKQRCYGHLEIEFKNCELLNIYSPDIANLCALIALFLENKHNNEKRKKARKKVLEESAKYKLLAENASDVISRLTLEGKFLYVSPSCRSLLGYMPDEMIEKNLYDFTPQTNLDSVKKFHVAILQNQKDNCLTHKFRKNNGEFIWLESHIKIVKDDANGSLIEMIAVSRDVTERKKLELLKEQAEQTMCQLINATSDAMCMLEPDGAVLYANETTVFRLQTTPEKLIGSNIFDFFPNNVKDSRKSKFQESISLNKQIRFEDIRDGRNIDQTFYPIRNAKNEIIKVAYYGYDITEQKNMQESLRNTQKTLKDVNKKLKITLKQKSNELTERDTIMLQQSRFASMGEMLSMIAHQWRQPLNAVSAASINIKMFYEMGMLNKDLMSEQCFFIEEQAQRMSKTINDFMEFFRPNRDKQLFNVSEAISCVLNIIESQLKNRSISVVLDIDKTISMIGRKNELEHVVLNIVSNARDAIESSGLGTKEIFIKLTNIDDENIMLSIKDSGGGIDKTIIDRIFDPYFTTKSALNGTGIGLYMSKIIINRNFSGTIKAYNLDSGAVFEILLPKQ